MRQIHPTRRTAMSRTIRVLSGAATFASGVTAAVYTIFSTMTMPSLAAMPAAEGLARMQQFNRDAEQGPFMAAFFGAAALSVATIAFGARAPRSTRSRLALVGSCLYLSGFVLTIVYHVPRNYAIAGLDASASSSVGPWTAFLSEWTAGNTVRAVLSTAATAAFAAAFFARGSARAERPASSART
ncbi:DUF1772 domain-containing protein [Rathayibacter rathayi]|uniref:DUF1772 domain-containing protein n=2 Tax=Rathayibacter rathayi TaxID=33887 RepID=A0ABX5A970_RATRA|nr:DUF1772 domain-containing protein [Rathayibacter rathayi]PPF45727.1 DUF1772 domain-containing protein [Rathayibacter rathayi]PPF78290.1 DUF1772 domain-containing protein [Rathayibacter rathayi]PPG11688.1 DUF1772 domain-containing protein [Rathayibacter rathayi]PPG38672.1 DUF1772 domain-containing protein [Rathayibacter rathayi]